MIVPKSKCINVPQQRQEIKQNDPILDSRKQVIAFWDGATTTHKATEYL